MDGSARVPLACDLPDLHGTRQVLQRDETQAPDGEAVVHPQRRLGGEQDLAARGVVAEPSGEVRHRAAGGEGPALARGPREARGPDVALAGADADIDRDRWMTASRIVVGPGRLLPDRQRGPDGGGRVGAGLAVLEDDHEPVAGGLVDVAAFRADRRQEEREVPLDDRVERRS